MRLWLTRDFGGFGDWLFALQCAKLLNLQRPDVELHVSFSTRREPIPMIVREAFEASDVRYLLTAPKVPYLSTGHLVYRLGRSTVPFVAGMLEQLRDRTGIALDYHDDVFPRFSFLSARPAREFIAMVSCGKQSRGSGGAKDWGLHNFAELAALARARGFDVVQLGAADDPPLAAANSRILGAEFKTVASILAGARAFVGLENGLTVLAGMLGVRCVTIYNGVGSPERLRYPVHQQFIGRPTPFEVATCL